MKLSKFANLLMIGLALTFAASGCKKKPMATTPLPGAITGKPTDLPGGMIDTNGVADANGTASPLADPSQYENWTRDAEVFKSETVFFAYDSAVIRTSEKSKIAKVADYLKANPGHALEVAGNCDERGTEEYNRALGERRALAARQELIRLGIDSSTVVTKSYGKDRPLEPLHSEAAWSKNRRDEFILLTRPN